MDFTYDDEQQALREAVRGLVHDVRRLRDAATDRGRRPGIRRGPLGPTGRDGRARAALQRGRRRRRSRRRSRSASSCQELGRVLAPEPYLACVVYAGGLVAAAGSAEQKADLLGRVAVGEIVLAAADTSPGARWNATRRRRTRFAGRRRLDADRRVRPGAGRRACRLLRGHRGAARRRHRRLRRSADDVSRTGGYSAADLAPGSHRQLRRQPRRAARRAGTRRPPRASPRSAT